MRILFLEQFGALGGAQQCLLELLPAIAERGWSATVAAPAPGPLLDLARAAGADASPILLGGYGIGSKSARDVARFALDMPRLARWIAGQKADLIYVNGPRTLWAAARGAYGRPVIFHAHHFLLQNSAKIIARWAIEQAHAAVIANCGHVANQFRECTGPDRLHVVYNGVKSIPFRPRNFGAQGRWRIGIVGRIAPMKGQTDFLRAARSILAQIPRATFVVCGEPMFCRPDYWNEVQRLAEGLPVEFPGWRDDIPAVLGELDLLVLPSNSAEATPRVIMEAFSAGVPVVTYAIGGIPEIVDDSTNGFLVPECEPQALARKILEVTRSSLAEVAQRARAKWEHCFTIDRWREQVTQVIAMSSATSTGSTIAWAPEAERGAPGAR